MITRFKDILEKTSGRYTTTIRDFDGVTPIPAVSLTTLTLTLYSIHSKAIINSRDGQDILNANNVTVDAAGLLTWDIQPLDRPILDDTLAVEIHRALFQWTWAAGAKAGKHQMEEEVRNLNKVT